jgi:fructokinase
VVRSLAADELAAYAALDIGGSGVRLEIYATNGIAINRYAFPLGTPVETLECVLSTLISRCVKDAPVPLGVASFGPIDLDPVSSTFGNITTTPKTWWQGFPLRSYLQTVYTGPVCIWIDNNCSALAEASARNLELDKVLVFIGVGTGFGAAAIRGRTPLLLNGHSEFGHMYVRRYPTDMFSGSCPFHGDCLEGLASGSAIIARQKAGYGTNVSLVAHYLAQASYTLTLMPQALWCWVVAFPSAWVS